MSDTLTVRDHSQPCEHGMKDHHCLHPGSRSKQKECCPGGREIVLKRVNQVFVEEAFAGVALNVETPVMWVEVSDE